VWRGHAKRSVPPSMLSAIIYLLIQPSRSYDLASEAGDVPAGMPIVPGMAHPEQGEECRRCNGVVKEYCYGGWAVNGTRGIHLAAACPD
jgi:hypothetical protein